MNTRTPRRAADGTGEARIAGDFSLLYLLEILFRRKRLFVLPVLLTPLLAVLVSYMIRPVFLSTTTILLGKDQILNPLVRYDTAVSLTDGNWLGSFQKIIYSRTLIEETLRSQGLVHSAHNDRQLEGLVETVRANTVVMSLAADSFQIGYKDHDPESARRMVETITSLFIDKSLANSRREATAAVAFLQKEMDHYKDDLDRSERALQTFRQQNAQTLHQAPALGGLFETYRAKLLDNQLELRQALLNESLIGQRLSGEKPMVISQALYVQNTPYQKAYQELQVRKGNLLATRDPSHPEVQKLDREMQYINQLLEDEKKKGQAQETQEVRSPIFQELSSRLDDTRIRIKVLEQSIGEFTSLTNQVQAQLMDVPAIEKEQNRLESEVKATREIYDTLRMKLEQARITCEVEIEQQTSRFSIIDPARAPLSRFKPKRQMFIIGGVFGGIFLAFGLVFLIEFSDPCLARPGELQQRTGLPVLGLLPKLYRFGERAPWRLPPGTKRVLAFVQALMHRPALRALLPLEHDLDRSLRYLLGAHRFVLPANYPADGVMPTSRLSQAEGRDSLEDAALDDYIERLRNIVIQARAAYEQPSHLVWAIASTGRNEGATLFTQNLAAVLAGDLRRPVCLMDANPPAPALSRWSGAVEPGWAEVVEGRAKLEDVLRPTATPNVWVLPVGKPVEHHEVLLGSAAFRDLLAVLRDRFAFTLIDTPALLANTDGQMIAPDTDGILFVARLYDTKKRAILAALRRLPRERIIGLVVNYAEYWIPNWLYRRI